MGDLRILYSLFFPSTIPVTSVFSTSMWRIHPSLYFFISSFSYIQSQPLTLSYKPQSPWSLITIPPRVVGLKYFTWSEEPGRLQFIVLEELDMTERLKACTHTLWEPSVSTQVHVLWIFSATKLWIHQYLIHQTHHFIHLIYQFH